MKTKRRSVNVDTKSTNKKIGTRNTPCKVNEEKGLSVPSSCQINNSSNKHSPNTRAKGNVTAKLEFDPYLFSKIDDECKLPLKKIKIIEKNCKDAAINTGDFSTMTDPILLGPCEPGTSIELRGIVWLETVTGLLVINVTWRGRTYVGTLLDSTKYEFAPSFSAQDFPSKFETTQNSRQNRGRKRYAPTGTVYQNELRSHAIRHSRRLSESLLYSNNNNKKSSARLGHNESCYIDSFSLSAEASFSGESENELNNYQKYSQSSKTRSVTRSLAKQTKLGSNDNDSVSHDIDNVDNFLKCSQENCFKRFVDITALRYHLQRCHNIFEETVKTETFESSANSAEVVESDISETKPDNISDINGLKQKFQRINGNIERKNDKFEFHSDVEIKVEETYSKDGKEESVEAVDIITEVSTVKQETELTELSINIPNLAAIIPSSDQTKSSKAVPNYATSVTTSLVVDHPSKYCSTVLKPNNPLKITESFVTHIPIVTQSSNKIRTISAPAVSIPVEPTISVTNTSLISNSSLSPALIKPKPSQATSNSVCNSQLKKLKPIKISTASDDNIPSFQIPSTSSISKKRPLIPLKSSTSQTTTMLQQRIIPSSTSLNSVSLNQSYRHSRPTIFSNVTPILPATNNLSTVSQVISSSILSTGCVTITASANNNQNNLKRVNVTSNNLSPTGMNSLLSLKPIQPKPKSSSILPTYSHPTTSTFANSSQPVNQSANLSNQTSYQRQILPSPMSKQETYIHPDERLLHKVDSLQSKSIKKKRRKPDKKLRLNFYECNRLKKLSINPIQPKHNNESASNPIILSNLGDSYKIDEENSHSPGYSDLSETNDTPAPILEKEIELKSVDCDKLVICTDFETTSVNRVSSSGSEHYDENRDTKPPALMPAVLSTDILNASINDIELSEPLTKQVARKKVVAPKDPPSNPIIVPSDSDVPVTLRHNTIITSSRKSFQSETVDDKIHISSISSSKVSLYNPSPNNTISKPKFPNKSTTLSAINDYVWMTKNSHDLKAKTISKCDKNTNQSNANLVDDSGKQTVVRPQSQTSNGRFSVKALTSPQEIVSRSFPSSSTVISVNPNTKLASTLFKN